MADIKFSPDALADLKDIQAYITEELCSEEAALNTVRRILKRIRSLGDFPEAGPLLRLKADVENEYRFLVCGSYIAFYRYEHGTVFIVRVLYGRRDYIRILFGGPLEEDGE